MTPREGSGPIAILAGSGELPLLLSDGLRRQGREHRILAFRGFADRTLRRRADRTIDLLDVEVMLKWLDDWRPTGVALAGTVQRPAPSALLNAFSMLRNRAFIQDLIARGDDSLLRGAVDLIEERGHRVIGLQEIAPELLAPSGVVGAVSPGPDDDRAIANGLDLLRRLSPYDIGQAAVVAGARVLAIEGPEGTDRMLARVRRLSRSWGVSWGVGRRTAGGVLIKTAKRGQDLRVDLPAIGPRTIVEAHRAGLAGIAIGAGSTLIINRERTIAEADRRGVFLVGAKPESGEP